MKIKDKRKGLQVNGNIEPANADSYRTLAVDARRGLHEFASDVLNLVTECAVATNQTWDQFKIAVPGFDEVARARRRAKAIELLTDGKAAPLDADTKFILEIARQPGAARALMLTACAEAERQGKPIPDEVRALLDPNASRRPKPAKPKAG